MGERHQWTAERTKMLGQYLIGGEALATRATKLVSERACSRTGLTGTEGLLAKEKPLPAVERNG